MSSARRPVVIVVMGLLVVLAGCSLPLVDHGAAETEGDAPTPSTTASPPAPTDTADDQGEQTTAETEDPTATATPTPEPTPTVESPTGIRVVAINADVEDVTDEYIVLKNTADAPLDLSGWRVKDEDGHVYTFPDGYRLGIDETVTLHSSRGTQTESDRYWWADGHVWDANGDTIAVYDDRGHKVYERSYS